jgi:aquaporin Z
MTKRLVAEFIGTLALVLFGCGAAVLAGDKVGQLGIAFAFGLAIVAMVYGIGPFCGAHLNPAVSFGAFVAGRINGPELAGHVVAQILGAIAGAGILLFIASGAPGYDLQTTGLGQNGWGPGYLGGYSVGAAFVFELVATFLFLIVILGVTSEKGQGPFAGIAIGLTLTAIHIVGIQVTGVSVNPARSIGPAVFVGGNAVAQLWLFIIAPLLGGGLAGLVFRQKVLEA